MTAALPTPPESAAQMILAPPAKASIFLTLTVRPGSEEAIREALPNISGLVRSIGFRIPENNLSAVTGIGADLWDRLFDAPKPSGLHPFTALHGDKHTAPATPGDLFFHIRATVPDMCFELARKLTVMLAGHVDVVDEVHGFRYWDDRDLLGFVDGSENPDTPSAQSAAVLIGGDAATDSPYLGSSYVIVQKYLHDLTAWEGLSVEQQELAVGRTKLDNIELSDDVKPSNAHIAVNVIEDEDGQELQILRANLPFGSVGADEFGTYFIGYAADPAVTERMLRRMFIGEPRGNYDRILDFSTAHTGCLFFVPPLALLDDPEEFMAEIDAQAS